MPAPDPLPKADREAHDALTAALRAAGGAPCQGRAEWLSEEPKDREKAARMCDACPVTTQCAAAGHGEVFGVWSGVDRASPEAVAQRRRRPAAA